MKNILRNTSALALALSAFAVVTPSSFAQETHSAHDSAVKKHHCLHKRSKCHMKQDAKKDAEVRQDRLNALQAIKNTPHVHYDVVRLFIKGGKERIARIDRGISNGIAASGNDIGRAAVAISPRDRDDYSVMPMSVVLRPHFNGGMAHRMHSPDGSPPPPPFQPDLFGRHQLFETIPDAGQYDIGKPRLTVKGGSLRMVKPVLGNDSVANGNSEQQVEYSRSVMKDDPDSALSASVSSVSIPSGESINFSIPRFEHVMEDTPVGVFYEFTKDKTWRTGRAHGHDVVRSDFEKDSGMAHLRFNAVNAVVMPWSRNAHGQSIILVKPTLVYGLPPSSMTPGFMTNQAAPPAPPAPPAFVPPTPGLVH